VRAHSNEGRKMKTRISVYWPLAVAVTLVALAAMQAYGEKARHEPLAAEQVSAELARTISYGLIDGAGTESTATVGQRASSAGKPQAS
jgi:hypothetical protein